MQLSAIPIKYQLVWGQNAGSSYITTPIPFPSQISVTAGRASFNDGFPPDDFIPVGAGGVPPWGQDFNGLENMNTSWLQWYQAGGQITYDATFQGQVNGYPNGAIVSSAIVPGNYWRSTADNNTSNPDTGGANWAQFGDATGDFKFRPTSENLQASGWLTCNGQTIGNASSGATSLASAICAPLYAWCWNRFSNTQCPVTGGRGANPAADFAANKPIGLPQMQGIVPAGNDTMGGVATSYWSGAPFTYGSATVPGSVAGEMLHVILAPELPSGTVPLTAGFVGSSAPISASSSFAGSSSTVITVANTAEAFNINTTTGGALSAWLNVGSGGNLSAAGSTIPVGSVSTTGTCTANGSVSGTVSLGSGDGHNTAQLSMLVTWYLHL